MIADYANKALWVFFILGLASYLLAQADVVDVPGAVRVVFFVGWAISLVVWLVAGGARQMRR